ncbi:hypothetical protein LJB75_01215 [Bacteroidales bacterium OttesenSCG-928-L19]|nr:hypothetical protein [Bacteroidales bacterium OttesenSCG-928-L19]
MKEKFIFPIFIFVLLFFSCSKTDTIHQIPLKGLNYVIPSNDASKGHESGYVITVGHLASACSGCVMAGGQIMHIDCMGPGTACTVTFIGKPGDQTKNSFFAIITTNGNELTAENYFLMPDRSLFVEDRNPEDLWLNIPAQYVEKDADGQFTFTGLHYSNLPLYPND